jgi:exosortase D (VPLPA-CTERM-specific)
MPGDNYSGVYMKLSVTKEMSGKSLAVFLLLLLALLSYTYYGGLTNLLQRWGSQDEYSYGYFIPLISAYFIYQKRTTISSIPFQSSWAGVFVVFFGLVLLAVGELSAIYILIHYSLVIVLLGLTLSIAGKVVFRQVFVPILILITAIPLPYFIDSELSWRLQLLSSKLGVLFIRLFDVPVFLEGNVIDLGYYKLQVVEACSGLSYLFPLMSLGFIVAYIYQAPFWQKIVLFLSTIPITVFMNSFRIGVIGILVNYWGIEQAEGFFHFFEGWVIFMACLFFLWLEMLLLIKLRADKPALWDVLGVTELSKKEFKWSDIQVPISKILVICLVLISSVAIITNIISKREEYQPPRKEFSLFPEQIGGWIEDKAELKSQIRQFLQLDDYYLGDYSKESNVPVNLYMAYYKTQRKGVSPHSPRVCIPGGGWKIVDSQTINIEIGDKIVFPVNRIIIQKNNTKQLVYYWFKQRNLNLANEYKVKWFLLKDAIVKNRTDGALIRLTTIIPEHDSKQNADDRIQSLISSIYPELTKFIPD